MLQESEFLQHFSHITRKLSWSQESITIQVNHVIRHICYPHFRIPCKRLREFLEGLEVKECRNKNLAALYILCQFLQLNDTLVVHRTN